MLVIFSLLLSLCGLSADLVTIGPAPNGELEFVTELMSEKTLVSESQREDIGTRWFSIFQREKLDAVHVIEVKTSEVDYEKMRELIQLAVDKAGVVLLPFTPEDGFLCLQMKKASKTLFVMPAGDFGKDLNVPGVGVTWCDAPNLLFVAARSKRGVLMGTSNYGTKYVRIAAPGQNVPIIDEKGRNRTWSSSLASAAIVASRVAHFHNKFPRLKGLYLAHRFLQSKTSPSRRISNKVKHGRILR